MLDLTDWFNKKYTTRNGNEVVVLAINAPGPQPIVGYIKYPTSETDGILVGSWNRDGNFGLSGNHGMDLINAKTKREGWVNLYKPYDEGSVARAGPVWDSKERANLASSPDPTRIACVRIEWEE